MSQKEFAGIFPYLVTPIDQSGNLKEDVLRDLVNHLISKGVHGLTPLGSTGEGAYFPWETKKRVVDVVIKAAAGRVPVIAGVNEMRVLWRICGSKFSMVHLTI
jgi:4-hydroxy-tetrahydrodipicolinate synthase